MTFDVESSVLFRASASAAIFGPIVGELLHMNSHSRLLLTSENCFCIQLKKSLMEPVKLFNYSAMIVRSLT